MLQRRSQNAVYEQDGPRGQPPNRSDTPLGRSPVHSTPEYDLPEVWQGELRQ